MATSRIFVFFDLGQTLVDLEGLVACIAKRLASQFPRIAGQAAELSAQWIRRASSSLPRRKEEAFVREIDVAAQVMSTLVTDSGIPLSPDGAEELLRKAWDDFEEIVHFCPGVSLSWLEEIRSLATGTAIVTDGDSVNVDRLVRRLRLSPHFDAIVTSESVGAYKPNPRIYESALKAVGAKAAESIFVSDTSLDLRGAAVVGMRTAFLPRDLLSSDPTLPPETFLLSKPSDLNELLR